MEKSKNQNKESKLFLALKIMALFVSFVALIVDWSFADMTIGKNLTVFLDNAKTKENSTILYIAVLIVGTIFVFFINGGWMFFDSKKKKKNKKTKTE